MAKTSANPRKTKQTRARSAEARAARRDTILDGAERLFAEQRFEDLHMSEIAKEIGLAKGTLYLYFTSKEALFVAVVQRSLQGWFATLRGRLGRAAFMEPVELANHFAGTLFESGQLTRLLALLHLVLQRNITDEEAIALQRFLAKQTARTGMELERLIPRLEPGDGARLVLHALWTVAGLRQASDMPPAVADVVRQPGLQHLQVEFSEELCIGLAALFRGFETRAD